VPAVRILRWLAVGALLVALGVLLGFAAEMLRPRRHSGAKNRTMAEATPSASTSRNDGSASRDASPGWDR
jgi:hypothetical protein